MKQGKLFLGMVLGGVVAVAGVSAHAQEQTTTTSESMTTTTEGPPMAPPSPGYESFGYHADNMAAHRGYNEGYDKGISDHDTGHSFRYKDDNSYRHPMGYHSGMPIPKDQYDKVYREAYMHGYEKGYRRSADSPQAR